MKFEAIISISLAFLCLQAASFSSLSFSRQCTRQAPALKMAKKTQNKPKKQKVKKKTSTQDKPKQKQLSYAERLKIYKERQAEMRGNVTETEVKAEADGESGGGPPTDATREKKTYRNRAKEMIAAQRKSVDMLTFVKERVEGLPWGKIKIDLEKKGFVVLDDFLASEEVLDIVAKEGQEMYKNSAQTSVDINRIGTGEYLVPIQGGDQYTLCPRMIEIVVSTTKHVPGLLKGYLDLDPANCMASLRVSDRKVRIATGTFLEEGDKLEMPFTIIATDKYEKRKLSLLYYPNSADWDGDGGVTFDKENPVRVPSKRDRLILVRSETCEFRKDYFVGKEELGAAVCLELDLVTK